MYGGNDDRGSTGISTSRTAKSGTGTLKRSGAKVDGPPTRARSSATSGALPGQASTSPKKPSMVGVSSADWVTNAVATAASSSSSPAKHEGLGEKPSQYVHTLLHPPLFTHFFVWSQLFLNPLCVCVCVCAAILVTQIFSENRPGCVSAAGHTERTGRHCREPAASCGAQIIRPRVLSQPYTEGCSSASCSRVYSYSYPYLSCRSSNGVHIENLQR